MATSPRSPTVTPAASASAPLSVPPRPLPAPFHADGSVPLARLEQAINRARQAQPAQGYEAALAEDVALLGRVYGRLIWRRAATLQLAELDEEERAAWDRWSD